MKKQPLVLIILDGWGYRKDSQYNAIALANTPNWDRWWQQYPHTLLHCSGTDVGLPAGQMGNSEVGHMHLGAGRMIPQDLTRIDLAIEDGSFNNNPSIINTIKTVKKNAATLHILGLVSPGGVHSHERHIVKLIDLVSKNGVENIAMHAFLDGRDTPPRSAQHSLNLIDDALSTVKHGKIASVIGRYFAMDRDKRWTRTEKAYACISKGFAEFHAPNAITALDNAYARDESDEFVKATCIEGYTGIKDGDAIIFMNFRADRARQISHCLLDKTFTHFDRGAVAKLSHFVSLTEYDKKLACDIAFPLLQPRNTFGEYLANQGLKQLRIAETEKYAHITFFFNGGLEKPFKNEDRILIPSPHVATYDLQPEMSAPEVTEKLIAASQNTDYAAIICNFANPDMVGHTGNIQATRTAIECIDKCLGEIVTAILKQGGEVLITADHGNAELMYNLKTQQPHTAHTLEPVPLLYIGDQGNFNAEGGLQDVAPTMLALMGLDIPKEMTGKNLIHF